PLERVLALDLLLAVAMLPPPSGRVRWQQPVRSMSVASADIQQRRRLSYLGAAIRRAGRIALLHQSRSLPRAATALRQTEIRVHTLADALRQCNPFHVLRVENFPQIRQCKRCARARRLHRTCFARRYLRAAALPPLQTAALRSAVVPPCEL